MKTIRRTFVILFVSLLISLGLWVLSGTAWAGGYADGVIATNQAVMDVFYATATAAGQSPAADEIYTATTANLLRIAGVAALVIVGSYLIERHQRKI
ncbi:protein of unknown function [Candidatus Promineifilum breve]|uniref:Uncharacterized protein n=1 Tax=Candidatus Promineifilum breve TaxID=1806508 RepID=A0A161K326_9CHLR|nr:hypothetical protein [Candidatus Promineifilum breve]CUS03497.2 protein of unknown function [Candidatus Promineifilum breve]